MKKLGLCMLALLCLAAVGCAPNDVSFGTSAQVVHQQDPQNPQWVFGSGEEHYEIGINAYGMPVFKDPAAAFDHFVEEYDDALQEIKAQFKLKPVSMQYWQPYKNLGWQIQTEDAELFKRCGEVSDFFDYFENSLP